MQPRLAVGRRRAFVKYEAPLWRIFLYRLLEYFFRIPKLEDFLLHLRKTHLGVNLFEHRNKREDNGMNGRKGIQWDECDEQREKREEVLFFLYHSTTFQSFQTILDENRFFGILLFSGLMLMQLKLITLRQRMLAFHLGQQRLLQFIEEKIELFAL